ARGAVDDDLALVAQDLEAVGADDVVGGGDEGAGDAVAVVGEDRRLVLDGDVAAEAEAELRRHGRRHPADPLPQVELVGRLVDQHAAALAAPGRAPGALLVVDLRPVPGGDQPAGAADRPDLAGVGDLPAA